MNKKLAVLSVACTILIVLGGVNSNLLYSTSYLQTKAGYEYSISSAVDWWDCNWSYYKKIIIDHTKVEADQTNFPVLIYRSADAELAAYAQSDGGDIIFIDSANVSQYAHEIEAYNSSTGELTAWVKVASLSSTVDTILYMYYGNPTCSNQQNITGTWDGNHRMVQHLNESSGTLYDSTSYGNNGTNNGALYNDSSKIDGGYDFDDTDYINCGNDSSLNITTGVTLEAWVKDPPFFWRNQQRCNVRIVNKQDEQRSIAPGEQFTVQRTVATDIATEVVFVALCSPGVTLNGMSVDGISVFDREYAAGMPTSKQESGIERIRNRLPDELKELGLLAYSKPFTVDSNQVVIQMDCEADEHLTVNDGQISYLVFAADDCYDFEGTTHWHYPVLIDWLNPFSVFESIIEFFTGGESVEGAEEKEQSVFIVDKHDEMLDMLPGTRFSVERTINGTVGSLVTVVPLFSNALTLEKMEIVENSTTLDHTICDLDKVGAEKEFKINGFVHQLSDDETQELEAFAYPDEFVLNGPTTIRFWFRAPSWETMQSEDDSSSGRISYLVFADGGDGFDFEGSSWWNSNWGYRKLITINSSQVDADLTNFPILVNITDSDLASKAQDDGDDIAFVLWSDNSTQLNHEIELFNGTSGELVCWVNVTSLSSSVDTKIWMYYNNSGCGSQENIDNTWDANYVGVWHLNHTSGNATDSTANNNDGNEYISPDTNMDTTGKTDGADYFDGSDDYLQPPALAVRSASSSFTVTGWFKATNSSNGPLWMWGDNAAPSSSGAAEAPVGWRSSSGNFSAGFYSGGHFYAEASQNYTDDVWHFAAQVGDGVTGYLYIDGQQLDSTTAGYTYASNPYLLLGVRTKNSGSDIDDIAYFNGSLDEVRVSDIARNSSWINTSYNTMNNIDTFISVSSERNITDTSVDTISPYTITSSPLSLNATGNSDLDNVTLWYRWSSDNFTSLGTGRDGAKTITADNTIINNYTYLTGNENSAETTITVNDASEFNAGDEILIIQMQNSSGGTSGTYEFATISSKSGNDITLNSGLTNSYYSGTFDQTSSTSAQIVSVPHYTTVTVNSNANITASAWDGYDGGIVVFRAIQGVVVNGAINASGKGYRGGLHGTPSSCGSGEGEQGESYTGKGTCGGYVLSGGENPNGGGGGLEVTGGGGGYGTAGEDSESWNGGGADPGAGGLQHGAANLEKIILGSGGGGCYQGGSGSGDGGDGGGIIIVFANSVSVSGDIESRGQNGQGYGVGSYSYGTGGGSGGSIYISAANLSIGNNLINASFGLGYEPPGATPRDGGDGGTGRIRLDYENLTGTTDPVSGYNGSAEDVGGCNWIEWSDINNPDASYVSGGWNWTFDFPNGTGYYEFYSIGNKTGSPNETAPSSADAICYYDPPTLPIVTTNASTGVEETNAILRGYLSSDGDLTTSCGFRYGTSSGSYSENFTKGTYSSGTEFSNNNGSLTQGQIYFYQAWAKNSLGFVNGTEMTFLTKPDPPNNLIAQTNSTSVIYLTWATGIGANNTYIERNASGQTVWTRGSGNMIYNGSGTNYEDTGLSEGITYYYKAWSYVNWTYDSTTLHQWSDNNASANNITHDIPSIELVNPSPNGTTGVVTQPICQIWANDSDSSTITVYWYENSTGPLYVLRNTSSESANSIVNYTFTEFDTYNTTYWWKVSVNDSIYNTTKWYYFTTGLIDTSVDTISPYTATYSPYNITATGPSDLDNVTLWYRYSTDNSSWGSNVSWNDASNPDNASLWSWDFDFPDGIGYYEFYSLGKKLGSPDETVPGSVDALCYFNVSVNNPPTQSNEIPANQSTGISITPQLNIVVDDGDLDTVNATWWSNSSGPWVQFASNLSIDTSSGAVNLIQTNSNFTNYSTTYWWGVNLSDGNGGWNNQTYYFTTEPINTSVDTINPYTQTNSPLTINATGPSSLENVTLWYKYSNDNSTWWNYSWSKSKPIYLNVSSGTTPTNYQILLNITYMNDMNNNFSDLRFVNYTNTSMELDYWIENKSDGNWANVWLEINSSINTTNQSLVWMYYGNPSATSNSNGTATFEFFDDFPGASLDTNIWSATGSYSVNDGITITTGAVYTDSTVLSSPQDLTFEMKAQYTGADASYSGLEIADAQSTSGSNGGANALAYHMTDSGGQDITLWGADGTVASYNIVSGGALTPNPTLGTDYILGYSFYGSTDISYFYQNLDYSEIDRATYSGTWDYPFYLWLGYFTGSASGGTNIDDITVSWVRIRKYRSNEPTYYIGDEVNSWIKWNNVSNPDNASLWSWDFDFPNGTGYYEFYSIGNKTGSPNETAPSSADALCYYKLPLLTIPTVTTNVSTGVEEMNATLCGYLSDNGNATTTCGFWYDTAPGGTSNNVTFGTVSEGSAFSSNASGLTPGQLYYFKAWANNSAGFNSTANELAFLTKPNVTISLNAQTNSSSVIYITWTKGDGTNNTYIERNASGQTVWTRGSGNMTYNGSGTNYEDTDLHEGTTYYYQAWSYTNWTYNPTVHQWSDENASASNTTNNAPILTNESPANKSTGISLNSTLGIQVNDTEGQQMNISWYWGTDSSCPDYIGTNSSVNNGTYHMDNDNNFSSNGQTYYWRLVVNDGDGGWTNATYHFRTVGMNKKVISKNQSAYSLEINQSGDILYGYINNNTVVQTSLDTSWHYVVMTYDGSNLRLYKDGALADTTPYVGTINFNTNNVTLGENLTGTLDEARISLGARDGNWINTTYQNTNDPGSFATFGSQVGVLSTWGYRKQISINASMVDNDLVNFPVLISTTDTDLRDNALTNGNDILFVPNSVDWTNGSYTQRYAHEVELWNSGTGQLTAWANVSRVSSGSDTTFYMYYGNTLCDSNKENREGVWDSNYVAVWHLNETGTGDRSDSTSNNNASTSGYEGDEGTTGIINGADDFDGTDDQLIASDSPSLSFTNDELTMEAWVKFDVLPPDETAIIRKELQWQLGFIDADTIRNLVSTSGTTGWTAANDEDFTFATGAWYYSVFVYDGSIGKHLINASQVGSTHVITGNINDNANDVDIGYCINSDTYLNGTIDEVRISKTSRNDSWINASYKNVNDSANFTIFGSQEAWNYAPVLSNEQPSNGAAGVSLWPSCNITVSDANGGSVDVYFYEKNSTGSWILQQTNGSVLVTSPVTVRWGNYSNASASSTKYWWSVNCTDGTDWTNETYNFTTAASPFIYLFNGQEYTKVSDFIPGATSKEKEYTSSVDVSETSVVDGTVRLKITEELDETTYLDRIYLLVDGTQIVELDSISDADRILLKDSDDRYLVMNQGAEHFLIFTIPEGYSTLYFVAEGYYVEHDRSYDLILPEWITWRWYECR